MSETKVEDLDSAAKLVVRDAEHASAVSVKSTVVSRANRPKKMVSRVNIWIRRIHLFSGLFMLPWVLLYGFTALLFNHPMVMTDWKTSIESFTLSDQKVAALPVADAIASLAIDAAAEKLDGQTIELTDDPDARFTRQVLGSVELEDQDVRVVVNLNDGVGYIRKRSKKSSGRESGKDRKGNFLKDGVEISLATDPKQDFRKAVDQLLRDVDLDSSELKIRSIPNIEFDANVDGEPVRMRLAEERSRNNEDKTAVEVDNQRYRGKLTVVGSNPRDLSARSFLLRLHMAHGYGIEKNSRWFWAIAVDLMFASMVFWGLSGVFMWWQIKRTRKLGIALLAASAVVATWLAIGMHWQLVNG